MSAATPRLAATISSRGTMGADSPIPIAQLHAHERLWRRLLRPVPDDVPTDAEDTPTPIQEARDQRDSRNAGAA
jgi:hypothetical protein